MTKNEMVGWHHQLYGHEFEQALGVDDGQGNMVSCSPWNSLDLNTGVGSISLLQWIFPTQGSNPCLPHCRQILYQLSYQESPKRSNQSILKEIPEYSFEGLILKLKLQYFGHLM